MNARDEIAARLCADGWEQARGWYGVVTLTRGPWALRLGRDEIVRLYRSTWPLGDLGNRHDVDVELRRQPPAEVVRIVRAICEPSPWDGAA